MTLPKPALHADYRGALAVDLIAVGVGLQWFRYYELTKGNLQLSEEKNAPRKHAQRRLLIVLCLLLVVLVAAGLLLPSLLAGASKSDHPAVSGATYRAGNQTVGYVSLPVSWPDAPTGTPERSLTYSYGDSIGSVTLSASVMGGISLSAWADAAYDSLEQMEYTDLVDKDASFAGEECRRISGSFGNLRTVTWVFATEQGTHLVAVEAPVEYADALAALVEKSFAFGA